jgi:signal-transduction protein with cAMP-binding, CBS, and nucleotidyltransferase domain
MENFYTLLARHPPFDGIRPEEVRAALEGASQHAFDTGETALVEDGSPALGLWVILGGSMDIVHEGEVIQVLEPGE